MIVLDRRSGEKAKIESIAATRFCVEAEKGEAFYVTGDRYVLAHFKIKHMSPFGARKQTQITNYLQKLVRSNTCVVQNGESYLEVYL